MHLRTIAVLSLAISMPFVAVGGSNTERIAEQDRHELNGWFEKHRDQRLASVADCDCHDEISELRRGAGTAWQAQPTYQPYYARGDFDGNGLLDFAVLVRGKDQDGKAQILVFLRQRHSDTSKIVSRPVDRSNLKGFGLFIGKDDGKRARLLAGTFGSEGYEVDLK